MVMGTELEIGMTAAEVDDVAEVVVVVETDEVKDVEVVEMVELLIEVAMPEEKASEEVTTVDDADEDVEVAVEVTEEEDAESDEEVRMEVEKEVGMVVAGAEEEVGAAEVTELVILPAVVDASVEAALVEVVEVALIVVEVARLVVAGAQGLAHPCQRS